MALNPGAKLGPYEIVAPLGAGGMGEVYRARDTRLGRDVAIKVLPSHLSSNADLKARFEREARAISSLNHPHICTLHDVGHQDGIDFLVMEFLEGETLDRRLQRGPLPPKQALEFGFQIAEALEKAHRAGLVHRDLKPGNVMLTPSGSKLLDFGLAKPAVAVLGTGASSGTLTPSTPTMNLPALSAPAGALTQQGTIVGTFQYMAPEVLRGQEADARSDLFSLGCVLYEMVTGQRTFEGKSQLSVLTAILEKDPEPISTLQPATPPALDYAVAACLEKNPDDRFQTAHDVKLQLGWIAKSGSQVGAPTAVGKRRRTRDILFPVAAAVLAVAVVTLAMGWWQAQSPRRVVRTTILPPEGTHFETLYRNGPPSLSPDGTRVTFVASREGRTSLWIRRLDKLDAIELPGTQGAYFPFWSPNGRSLGFFANGKLWRMDVSGGGSPIAICDAPEARGGTWTSRNTILFTPTTGGPILRVLVEGGKPVAATPTPPNVGGVSDRWPFALPDGKHFLYVHTPYGAADDRDEVHFGSVDNTTDQLLLPGRYSISAFASGWLLTGRHGSVMAWRFDPGTGKVSGDAVQIADKVAFDDIVASSVFSVSQQGTLLYQQGAGTAGEHHVWVDASGKQLTQISDPGTVYGATRLSPDGSRIATAVVAQNGSNDLWTWDLARGTRARLSFDAKYVDTPAWSADGRTIYFAFDTGRGGGLQIEETPADGSHPPRVLIAAPTESFVADPSNDGKWLLYEETLHDMPQYAGLKAFPLATGLKAFLVLERVDSSSNARLIPDSNEWLAYQSSESGRAEVYLTSFPNAGAKYQVSQTGGTQPVWSKDGKRLYYLDTGQRLTAVDIRTDKNSVQIGAARVLFQTSVRTSIPGEGYDVARDRRFLLVNSVTGSPAPLTLVTNWDVELGK
jgi:eukaryotic-like serine/threonine-protein kinase